MAYKCPPEFDTQGTTCHAKCPPGFKYNQVPNKYSGYVNKCVLFTDNSKSFELNDILMWAGFGGTPQDPAVFQAELTRVAGEAAKIQSLAPYEDNMKHLERESNTITSQYAGFQAVSDAGRAIQETTKNIREPRPSVQPNEITAESRSILSQPNLLVIQVALFTILLGMVELLVIPTAYVQGILFLTLCVGAAAGIYLSNT